MEYQLKGTLESEPGELQDELLTVLMGISVPDIQLPPNASEADISKPKFAKRV